MQKKFVLIVLLRMEMGSVGIIYPILKQFALFLYYFKTYFEVSVLRFSAPERYECFIVLSDISF